jgi:hypothetical protein
MAWFDNATAGLATMSLAWYGWKMVYLHEHRSPLQQKASRKWTEHRQRLHTIYEFFAARTVKGTKRAATALTKFRRRP